MRITVVEAMSVEIPLPEPIWMGGASAAKRDFVLVHIRTDEGVEGVGYTYGRGVDVAGTVERNLAPILVGRDPLLIEALWQEMNWATRLNGRQGVVPRAVSVVDIALWDLKGKVAGLPLYKLLGGYRDRVPALVAGGYYKHGKDLRDLQDEFRAYVAAGYERVKLMIGGASFAEDVERIRAVRDVIGPSVELAVDLNGIWRNAKAGLRMARQLEAYDLAFLEEPFHPDHLPAYELLARNVNIPLAVGEFEAGRYGFRELLTRNAVDVLRHDATYVGGITEWLRVAAMGASWDVSVLPHFMPEIHVHLVAAVPNGVAVELIDPETGVDNFHYMLKERLAVEGGFVHVPREPGLGLPIDWDVVDRYRVS